jgi:heme exporter protein CcmD
MSAWFAMGGYWEYVWPAYAISFATLAAMVGWTLVAYRRAVKRVQGAAPDAS